MYKAVIFATAASEGRCRGAPLGPRPSRQSRRRPFGSPDPSWWCRWHARHRQGDEQLVLRPDRAETPGPGRRRTKSSCRLRPGCTASSASRDTAAVNSIAWLAAGHYIANLAWAPLFFGLVRNRETARRSTCSIAASRWSAFKKDVALIPYAAWLSYATILNLAICRLNPAGVQTEEDRTPAGVAAHLPLNFAAAARGDDEQWRWRKRQGGAQCRDHREAAPASSRCGT